MKAIGSMEMLSANIKNNLNNYQLQQINHYIDILLKWNKIFNLTAITDRQQVIDRHVKEGLDVTPYCQQYINNLSKSQLLSAKILDLGSGMGIPGIILAIMMPEQAITLLDSNNKKTSFLLQVKIELGLNNLTVITQRAQDCQQRFDLIIARAFASCEVILNLAQNLLIVQGTVLAMKSNSYQQELAQLSKFNHDNWHLQVIDLKSDCANKIARYLLQFDYKG